MSLISGIAFLLITQVIVLYLGVGLSKKGKLRGFIICSFFLPPFGIIISYLIINKSVHKLSKIKKMAKLKNLRIESLNINSNLNKTEKVVYKDEIKKQHNSKIKKINYKKLLKIGNKLLSELTKIKNHQKKVTINTKNKKSRKKIKVEKFHSSILIKAIKYNNQIKKIINTDLFNNNSKTEDILNIRKQIVKLLNSCNIKKINIQKGDKINLNKMIILEKNKSSTIEKGRITKIIKSGYKYKKNILIKTVVGVSI